MLVNENQFIKAKLKANNIQCNCGAFQYGTGHSPDCEYILATEDFHIDFLQLKYEEEGEE
jgi:hypothetical protein